MYSSNSTFAAFNRSLMVTDLRKLLSTRIKILPLLPSFFSTSPTTVPYVWTLPGSALRYPVIMHIPRATMHTAGGPVYSLCLPPSLLHFRHSIHSSVSFKKRLEPLIAGHWSAPFSLSLSFSFSISTFLSFSLFLRCAKMRVCSPAHREAQEHPVRRWLPNIWIDGISRSFTMMSYYVARDECTRILFVAGFWKDWIDARSQDVTINGTTCGEG